MSPRAAGPADPDAYAALEEQRDFLLGSLDDLERERAAGDIDEADYEALRDDYTARAAAVLRALDDGGARFAVGPTAGRLEAGRRGHRRGAGVRGRRRPPGGPLVGQPQRRRDRPVAPSWPLGTNWPSA